MNHAIEMLDSVADLHLGNIDMGEWLQRLTVVTECSSTCTVSWTAGLSDTVKFDYSAVPILIDQPWISAMDKLISDAKPAPPGLLDEIAKSAGALPKDPKDPLNNPDLMVCYLDSEPARTLLILRCDEKPGGWSIDDRKRIQMLLPVLLKAHQLHRKLVQTGNHLDIANKVLHSIPRGIVGFSKDLKILKANKMAEDILSTKDIFVAQDGELVITNDVLRADFYEWLRTAWSTPAKELEEAVWHRGFYSHDAQLSYQLTARVDTLENWNIESSSSNRFASLFIAIPETPVTPTQAQLKEFYGLTRAQARLVIALLSGMSITQASEELNISINTSRSHLRTIYNKLGVDSKAELLRLLAATLVEYTSTHKMLRR